MDEIRTAEERFLADFENSTRGNTETKKIVYENDLETIDDTIYNLVSKKRRLSMENHKQRGSLDLRNTSVSSSTTLNDSVDIEGMSSWDIRRLKADLAEAQARANNFKVEVERLHKLRQEGEILYESKVRELTKQCEFTANKVQDMEYRVGTLKKREHMLKCELNKVTAELTKSTNSYETEISKLEYRNHELIKNHRALENEMTNNLRSLERDYETLKLNHELACSENVKLKAQVEEYTEKSESYNSLQNELVKITFEFEEAKKKIKSLEYEVASYGDWKNMEKMSQHRLSEIPKKDSEMQRLQTFNKNLLDTVGNKLLLEEQVCDLKGRLEKYERDKEELVRLKVTVSSLEEELKEWKRVAKDHCVENSLICPYSLRSRIEEILQKDILLTSEQGNIKIEKHSHGTQLKDLQNEKELLAKNNDELNKVLQHRSSVIQKIQKKLLLVAKERDFYKNIADTMERDLTISGNMTEATSVEQNLRSRVEMLEKSLQSYKDLCENLEGELSNIKAMPEIPFQISVNGSDYDYLKKVIDDLKLENERLKRRKEELELEIEQIYLRGDFNIAQFKVVHLADNPAAVAYENSKNEVSKLHAEIERLRRKNKKLEEDREEMTTKLSSGETTDLTKNFIEAGQLQQKVDSLESKIKTMKEVYKSARFEFREVVYMLLGYKIDVEGHNYRISNVFAENETDYLNFRLTESGTLDMLESGYLADALVNNLHENLSKHKSLPVFLSQLTLELFNRTTLALE